MICLYSLQKLRLSSKACCNAGFVIASLLPVELHYARRVAGDVAQFRHNGWPFLSLAAVGAVLLLPLSFLFAFLTVSYLDAAFNVAFVDLRPGFIETLVLAIGEVQLFPAAVAGGDKNVDMGIVGIGMEGVKSRIGFELGGFEPLPGHAHSLVPIHGSIKAQDRAVVAPLTAALLGEFTEEIGDAPALIVAGDAEVFFVGDVACFP